MPRNTFFSFDFDDVRAANIVRNSNVVKSAEQQMAFRDHSLYESVKRNDAVIKKAIDEGLKNTSVTVVINGGDTWCSRWVRYEIAASLARGNGIMVVDVDGVGLHPQPTRGVNPLDYMAAYPWGATLLGGAGFGVREWNLQSKSWEPFGMMSSVSNSEAKYPTSFVSGNPYKLSSKFTRRHHWDGVKLYFETHLNEAAHEVGHRRSDLNWI